MATMNVPTTDRRHIPERRTNSTGERHAFKMSVLDYVAMILLIIGGLNWATVALFNIDMVATLFGFNSPGARLVYLLVGVAALYSIYLVTRWASRPRLHS